MTVTTKKKAVKKTAAPKAMAAGEVTETSSWEARGDVYEDVRKEFERSSSNMGGGGAGYIKLDKKANQLRIARDPAGGKPMVLSFRQHRGQTPDGKFATWLDLGWLVEGENGYGSIAAKLTDEDREKIARWGDPLATLSAAVREKVPEKKLNNLPKDLSEAKVKPFSEKRAIFTAIQEGAPGVLEVGVKLYEQIAGLFESNPEVFRVEDGYDIVIGTNGQSGFQKRYTGVHVAMRSKGTVEYSGNFPDLVQVLARRVPTWRQKYEFCVNHLGKWMAYAGVTKKDLGG